MTNGNLEGQIAIDRAMSYHHQWMLKVAVVVVKGSLERAMLH